MPRHGSYRQPEIPIRTCPICLGKKSVPSVKTTQSRAASHGSTRLECQKVCLHQRAPDSWSSAAQSACPVSFKGTRVACARCRQPTKEIDMRDLDGLKIAVLV